jgi:hypothetical protein
MKTDPKKLTLNQETLMNLTDSPTAKPKLFTIGLNCLETNCICCHGKF